MAVFCQVLRIFFSILYTLLGIAGFIAFIYFKNYPSSCLAVLTGIINGVLSHIHVLAFKRILRDWYENEQLKGIYYFSLVMVALGGMGLGYFGVSEITLRREIVPVSDSLIIPIIWSFLTLKSAGTLMYYCYYYDEGRYREEPRREAARSLIVEDQANEANESIAPTVADETITD